MSLLSPVDTTFGDFSVIALGSPVKHTIGHVKHSAPFTYQLRPVTSRHNTTVSSYGSPTSSSGPSTPTASPSRTGSRHAIVDVAVDREAGSVIPPTRRALVQSAVAGIQRFKQSWISVVILKGGMAMGQVGISFLPRVYQLSCTILHILTT
jgi:hypothetical protein